MKKVTVYIERGSNGTFGAYIKEDMPYGIIGEGATVADVIKDFNDGYEDMKAFYEEIGKKLTEFEFEFMYDVPSFLQYYAFAFSLAGLERITGVNQGQLSHYINGVKKPRPCTVKKIEERLRAFGKEISNVQFFFD